MDIIFAGFHFDRMTKQNSDAAQNQPARIERRIQNTVVDLRQRIVVVYARKSKITDYRCVPDSR